MWTDEPAVVVYVHRKTPERFLPPSFLLPRRLYVGRDSIEVDVVETGPFYAQSFTRRERPAPSGISIGNEYDTGTFGALVIDTDDGTINILSNNHVIARTNAGHVGDLIIQPGLYDDGYAPGDIIARLKRFIPLDTAGNFVDAAIAQVANQADVIDQVKNNLIPTATAAHPAVGLQFAGNCARTLFSPIRKVCDDLNIAFPGGPGVIADAAIGDHVEKVGRTTEYTTATVTDIDVEARVQYEGRSYAFYEQIACASLCLVGDSGSVVYRGGEGGLASSCGWVIMSMAGELLGSDLDVDAAIEHDFRWRYFQQTRVGAYLVDAYFVNEQQIVDRLRHATLSEEDRRYLRRLYDTYIGTAREVALQPMSTSVTLTAGHVAEAREALRRFRPHLSEAETGVAELVLDMMADLQGRPPQEILRHLNDENVLRKAIEQVNRLDFLRQPDERR